jgi:hypothetical protein
MPWTQLYVSGLDPSTTLATMEVLLSSLFSDEDLNLWAGPGTTIMKETRSNEVFCFVAFLSLEGALAAREKINNYVGSDEKVGSRLQAEISQTKLKKVKHDVVTEDDKRDLRLRRKGAPSRPKHPVIKSSAPSKKSTR